MRNSVAAVLREAVLLQTEAVQCMEPQDKSTVWLEDYPMQLTIWCENVAGEPLLTLTSLRA